MHGRTGDSSRVPSRPSRRLGMLLACVALVALAGCGAPADGTTPTGEPSPTATDVGPATTDGSTPAPAETATPLPTLAERGVDVSATWNRTLGIVGANATQPSVRVTRERHEFGTGLFLRIMAGGEPPTLLTSGWYDPEERAVVVPDVYVTNASTAEVEATLAHEFAHAIQYQQGWTFDDPTLDTDILLPSAYSEGFASYVQRQYAARYTNVAPLTRLADRYENASTYERFAGAAYVYGLRYVERRVAATDSLEAAMADPPASTEQVLRDTDDVPRELQLRIDYDLGWSMRRLSQRGELYTRVLLRDELPRERAIAAARGWGVDRLRRVWAQDRNESGYVWVHRWDTAADADEFAAAMATYLDRRRTDTDAYAFASKRVAPETTVVLAGTDGFVANASIERAANDSVRVGVGG